MAPPEMSIPVLSQYGAKFLSEAGYFCPSWKVEPDISVLQSLAVHHLQNLLPDHDFTVSLLSQGAFNRTYEVSSASSLSHVSGASYILRVSLPVDPHLKTASEAATMEYVRYHTTIPVAHLIAYDASVDNELGFEWIITEKLPGVSLESLWESISLESQVNLTREISGYIMQLESIRFPVIGSLYFKNHNGEQRKGGSGKPTAVPNDTDFELDTVVSLGFFRHNRPQIKNLDRGPFTSSGSWMKALVNTQVQSCNLLPPFDYPDVDPELDRDLNEMNEKFTEACVPLLELIPHIFPCDEDEEAEKEDEYFVLMHRDLDPSNILLDPVTHKVTGILDWELVTTNPLWISNEYPAFMIGDLPIINETVHPRDLLPPDPPIIDDNGGEDEFWWYRKQRLVKMVLRGEFDYSVRNFRKPDETEWNSVRRTFEDIVSNLEAFGHPKESVQRWAEDYINLITREDEEWEEERTVWMKISDTFNYDWFKNKVHLRSVNTLGRLLRR